MFLIIARFKTSSNMSGSEGGAPVTRTIVEWRRDCSMTSSNAVNPGSAHSLLFTGIDEYSLILSRKTAILAELSSLCLEGPLVSSVVFKRKK
jgi:hypothetical protein